MGKNTTIDFTKISSQEELDKALEKIRAEATASGQEKGKAEAATQAEALLEQARAEAKAAGRAEAEAEAAAQVQAAAQAAAEAEAQAAQRAVAQAETSAIYCKLPAGISFPLPDGRMLKLNGFNHPDAVAGFGITRNVPADDWDYVKKVYGEQPLFKNQIVFQGVAAEAKEKSGIKTGLEGINPKKPGKGLKPYKKEDND